MAELLEDPRIARAMLVHELAECEVREAMERESPSASKEEFDALQESAHLRAIRRASDWGYRDDLEYETSSIKGTIEDIFDRVDSNMQEYLGAALNKLSKELQIL